MTVNWTVRPVSSFPAKIDGEGGVAVTVTGLGAKARLDYRGLHDPGIVEDESFLIAVQDPVTGAMQQATLSEAGLAAAPTAEDIPGLGEAVAAAQAAAAEAAEAATAWAVPDDVLSPGPYPSSANLAANTVAMTTIADGSRFYDGFPKMTRLPSGRIIVVAYRGVGHSPSSTFNDPRDSEFGETPANPPAEYGDLIVSYSDDDGVTWSTPASIAGNMYGGDTRWVYGGLIGVTHSGQAIVVYNAIAPAPGDGYRRLTIKTSPDGVTWSASRQMVITSIEGGQSAGVDENGQPRASSIPFGDIVRIPGTKKLALQMRGATNDGGGNLVYRYICISEDDGLTWSWKRQGSATTFGLTEGQLTEEGALIAASATDLIQVYRASTVNKIGRVAISKDCGETWTSLGEPGGEAESNGYNMPQTGHMATIDGHDYVVLHLGTRKPSSFVPSVPYGHYVYITKAETLLSGNNNGWKLVNQISFETAFDVTTTDTHGLQGWRDLYIGVVSDPRTLTVLSVNHDEKSTARKSSLHSYRLPLLKESLNAGTDVKTWTPTITGATVAGTHTYSAQAGSYVKIGRLVHCTFVVTINGTTDATGSLSLGDLPFTPASGNTEMAWLWNQASAASISLIGARIAAGTTTAVLWHSAASTTAGLDATEIGTSFGLRGSITYIASS